MWTTWQQPLRAPAASNLDSSPSESSRVWTIVQLIWALIVVPLFLVSFKFEQDGRFAHGDAALPFNNSTSSSFPWRALANADSVPVERQQPAPGFMSPGTQSQDTSSYKTTTIVWYVEFESRVIFWRYVERQPLRPGSSRCWRAWPARRQRCGLLSASAAGRAGRGATAWG